MLSKALASFNPNSELSRLVRRSLLTLLAVVAFVVAAFMWHAIAGWVAIGVGFLVLDYTLEPDAQQLGRR